MPHNTQYYYIFNLLTHSNRQQFSHSQMAEIEEDRFWKLRQDLIRSARGHLIIAGPSLMDAFNLTAPSNKCIVEAIKEGVNAKQLEKLSVVLTDPILFDPCEGYSQPILDMTWAVTAIQDSLYDLFERNQIELHIYFLPMLQIDHAVITEEFLAMRSTKLWTKSREFKGAFVLYLSDWYTKASSEYRAHKKYLQTIMNNSTEIYPDVDTDVNILGDDSARSRHMQWRKRLRDKNYKFIFMHKLYHKQLSTFVRNSWHMGDTLSSRFIANSQIKNYTDLFDYRNLLGDNTQRVLLDYLKETESLFNQVIQKHNPSDCRGCQIFPSLDLGMPNNVQRLAGGFATGMLITWDCGIDIVPIDAKVNVCTSSVFKLDYFDSELLAYSDDVDEALKKIFDLASEEKGYSFSFTSGNHFLLIGTSMSSQGKKEYYLVLHSSANELKNSYMGLYPVEENWYSGEIKYMNGANGRYFRYLKDDTARHFISMAHHFEQYNEQIHEWLAKTINDDKPCSKHWINHHYYMPTDTSIAIGTFAESVGEEVPIFSAPGKPIYIFKIGADNWKVDLGENRGSVCVIPHGWGQKIDHLQSIRVQDENLILDIGERLQTIPINSKRRIECPEKVLRRFNSGEDFLKIGSQYVHGEIKKIITPCYEYSFHTRKMQQ